MSGFKKNMGHKKNKFAGGIKEATGKVTGNEQLELKGKIQSSKADLKKNMNAKDKIEGLREGFAGKINNRIDRKKKHKK